MVARQSEWALTLEYTGMALVFELALSTDPGQVCKYDPGGVMS